MNSDRKSIQTRRRYRNSRQDCVQSVKREPKFFSIIRSFGRTIHLELTCVPMVQIAPGRGFLSSFLISLIDGSCISELIIASLASTDGPGVFFCHVLSGHYEFVLVYLTGLKDCGVRQIIPVNLRKAIIPGFCLGASDHYSFILLVVFHCGGADLSYRFIFP